MDDLVKTSPPVGLVATAKRLPSKLLGRAGKVLRKLAVPVSKPRRWAIAGTTVTLVLGGAIPWLLEYTVFDPMLAVTLVMTIAIIWTAAYAAENLQLLSRVARAEHDAILAVSVHATRNVDGLTLPISIRNLGKGAAIDVRSKAWLPCDDGEMWIPVSLTRMDSLEPLGAPTIPTRKIEAEHLSVQSELSPFLLVEVSYRQALPGICVKQFAFDWVEGEDQNHPIFVPTDWPGGEEIKRRRDKKLAEIQTATSQAVESRPEVSIVLEESNETSAHLSCRWEGRGKSDHIHPLRYPLHDFSSWAESLIREPFEPPTSPTPQQPAEPPDSDPPEDSQPEQTEA